METKLISVIVPVYNMEKYLQRCVDSILRQTYKNIEIILVNDGSLDSSKEICDACQEVDSRIKVIHKENGGLSSARNAGIVLAKGEYLFFVDSDDWIADDCIEYLYLNAVKYNADICSGKYLLTGVSEARFPKQGKELQSIHEEDRLQYYLDSSYNAESLEIPVWNKLYKRDLFNEIRFPEGQIYEDMYTNFLLIEKSSKWIVTNKYVYFYFQQGTSITRSVLNEKNFQLIDVCDQIINKAKNLNNEELIQAAVALKCKNLMSLLIKMSKQKTYVDREKEMVSYLSDNKNAIKNSRMTKLQKLVCQVIIGCYPCFKVLVNLFYNMYNSKKKSNG